MNKQLGNSFEEKVQRTFELQKDSCRDIWSKLPNPGARKPTRHWAFLASSIFPPLLRPPLYEKNEETQILLNKTQFPAAIWDGIMSPSIRSLVFADHERSRRQVKSSNKGTSNYQSLFSSNFGNSSFWHGPFCLDELKSPRGYQSSSCQAGRWWLSKMVPGIQRVRHSSQGNCGLWFRSILSSSYLYRSPLRGFIVQPICELLIKCTCCWQRLVLRGPSQQRKDLCFSTLYTLTNGHLGLSFEEREGKASTGADKEAKWREETV